MPCTIPAPHTRLVPCRLAHRSGQIPLYLTLLFLLSPARATAQPALWAEEVPGYADALRLARLGHPDAAVERLESLRRVDPADDLPPGPVIDFTAGRILEEARRVDEALTRYTAAVDSPLSDAALLRAGRLRLAQGDAAGARADLGGVSPASGAFSEARLLMTDSLLREGRFEAAQVIADDLLQDELSLADLFAARMARVNVLAAEGRIERARSEAFLAWVHASTEAAAARAATRLAALGDTPGPAHRVLRNLIQAHGRVLQQMAKQVRRGPTRFARLDPGLPSLIQGVAARSIRRTRDRAVTLLEQAVAHAVDPRVRDYAVLSLARALVATGQDDQALVRFLSIFQATTPGPFAAHAGFEASRCATRLGDSEQAATLLETLAQDHPEGGAVARIQWERVLAALVAGDDATALERLDAALVRMDRGGGVTFQAVERLRYFRGVVLARLGRKDAAERDWQRVARGDPWSYYGVLAAARLGPARAPATKPDTEAGRFPDRLPEDSPPLGATPETPGHRPDLNGPLWLWRMGLAREARADLTARARLGMLDEDGTRLLARMIGQGRSPRGVLAMQEHLRGTFDPDDGALFVAAHPRPYAEAVDTAAQATGIDPALIYAVMCVESRFSPRARSPAGAIGLMQLLRTTARRIASVTLGDRRIAARVTRPSTNILIGASLLQELGGHFRGHLPLMLVGYHAGSGAARRFHRTFGHLPTDVFVEVLPYAQTVRYIQRVVGLAAGYRALYDDAARGPLQIDPDLPKSLGPFLERSAPVPGA